MSESIFCQPAEWEPQSVVWTAWPSHAEYWEGHIEDAREHFLEFLKVLADKKGESSFWVKVWVDGLGSAQDLIQLSKSYQIEITEELLGDIWFRDIAPVFVREAQTASLQTRVFKYNGWGNKYLMPHDETVGGRIAQRVPYPTRKSDWVFEGGALDVDGEGTALTTEECLLNKNRNPHLSRQDIEDRLYRDLGVQKLIWINEGLLNDHTDGHIDNIARFVAKGKVVCMKAFGADDPNAETYDKIYQSLVESTVFSGELLEVIQVPSPGKIVDEVGQIMPASYMNFLISNQKVIVPLYGSPADELALEVLRTVFPDHQVSGIYAKGILYGGGSFHCITQQQPLD